MAEPNNPEGGDKPEDSYSVWALPPSDIKDRLKSLMSSLRSEFGGPAFDPHITVVGDLRLRRDEAIARFHSAIATLKPYTARIAGVAYGTFFYQCVYLLIHPSPEVVETSSHCCGHLGYKRSTPYMPHVSLIYGDLSDEEKERARKRAEEIDESVCGLTFEVSSLALCKTDTLDKTTESWEMVELCDLTKKDFA
ncbi:cyclic phosphodiesterase isoform X1 [Dendrobium catenatum]|uniref:Cyclic phosphodiesterase n=1 Tax=Dendrobium catenatum TaxID=906689 RepID=A0A2I0WYE3_9ASPA|nr:cyclic phosphodiesterase isoform X1 [Dendrobium catenatum]XP_028550373.1 cyclic phosphodiesterase isoform X1 [Dendrobium catenatum]XP_028550374.1 cyclic phosphodiesterase isoform X1 [Dendrobium catenatum]XP_028550375.1 cyclic phosphodiesterase isoform X1 [Dendrobium catenatum]PKU80667.1 Cyclic phosphodiesterase [Dendrobium catenatum]